jgi:hypothetical protein
MLSIPAHRGQCVYAPAVISRRSWAFKMLCQCEYPANRSTVAHCAVCAVKTPRC